MKTLHDIKIEKAKIEDIDEIFALEQVCFNEDAFSKRQFKYLVSKANGVFVLVRRNRKIIAYLIMLKRKNSRHYRIYSIAILPEERGLGIAIKLLEFAEKTALKSSTHKISLEVGENNIAAINLYLKLGYQKVGNRSYYYADGSDALIMTKEF
ncbi:MAG: ribosomal protein S18-alanine N-acetyltransferase [Bacteroidetes bacterium]|nr:ribosomal protein S18-alanine N-acetyltransferase [Bacteroidota bacterium]